jgi:hypothetical protein
VAVDTEAVRHSLVMVEAVRRTARRRLSADWFPLQAFGAAMLGAGLGGLAGGPIVLRRMLLAASIVASAVVLAFYRRRGTRIGLRRRAWPYAAVAGLGIAACVAVGTLLPGHPAETGPWLVAAAICLAFAALQRSLLLVAWAGIVGSLAATAWVVAPTAPAGALTCLEGLVAIVAGTAFRLWHRGP